MILIKTILQKPISILLLALPGALIAHFFFPNPTLVFALSGLGLIPLASYLGEATEAISAHTNPSLGGFLNATLGNAAELIITIVAIRDGLLDLVKASITGSILGNLLLVMGMAFLLGGLKNGLQVFQQKRVSRNAILLILAVIALVVPSMLSQFIGSETSIKVETLSLGTAGVMIILYMLALIYGFKNVDAPFSHDSSEEKTNRHSWTKQKSIIVLVLSTFGVVLLSELLIGSVEPVIAQLGVSEFFLGVILIPIIGNVAEHLVAVTSAVRNQMELSVEIATSSSLQIALFVAPVLVFVSLLFGKPLQLIFNPFELLALITGILITALVCADGESNWLEGAELLAVYGLLGLAFFLLP